jgi:hypothetical protein
MLKKILAGTCVSAMALLVACGKSSSPVSPNASLDGSTSAASDGSTLKIGAPTLVAPINNFVFPAGQGLVTFSWNNVSGTYATFPVTYELEIKNANGTIVASPKVAAAAGATTSFQTTTLAADTIHSWRVRATYNGLLGPWSINQTFRSAIQAVLDFANSFVFDPLTTGFSVGQQSGGHFSAKGWTADDYTSGLNYDLKACASCRMEFDITGVGNGLGNPADLKFFSMGDGSSWGSLGDFRDAPWKMTLEQRGDGSGNGMKLIWRIGTDADDHNTKFDAGPNWKDSTLFHFLVQWTPETYLITINNDVWFEGDLQDDYTPPNFRISLGCSPRMETLKGATWSNVKINKI